jgi:hypothetical protein
MKLNVKILEKQDYVDVSPFEKESLEYKMTYLIKEEIRKHIWIENENGRNLTWEQARDEWISLYKKDFVAFTKTTFSSKKKKVQKIELRSGFKRRVPVVTGSLV